MLDAFVVVVHQLVSQSVSHSILIGTSTIIELYPLSYRCHYTMVYNTMYVDTAGEYCMEQYHDHLMEEHDMLLEQEMVPLGVDRTN